MTFYRFETKLTYDGFYRIEEWNLKLVKETPKGYWISHYYNSNGLIGKPIWVSKTAKKRYAYPDREIALKSFIKRKERQIKILTDRLRGAETTLNQAKSLLEEE